MRFHITSATADYKETSTYNGQASTVRQTKKDINPLIWSRSDVTRVMKNSEGFRPPTAYKSKFSEHTPLYVASTQQKPGISIKFEATQWYSVDSVFPEAMPVHFNTRNKTLLINNAFRKLKEQEMNLAMTLVFVRETAGLITGHASKLSRAYYFIKRGKLKVAADILGVRRVSDLRDLYLSVLFGWMQLARDLQGAARMLNDLSRPKYYYIYGRSKNEHQRTVRVNKTGPYIWGRPCNLECHANVKTTQKVVVIGQVTSEGLHNLKKSGTINPMLLMWDLLRWSWVVDQFASIGSYLDAYDATVGLDYKGGTYTLYTQSNGSMSPIPVVYQPHTGYVMTIDTGIPCVFKQSDLNRELVRTSDIGVVLKNPFDMDIKIALAAVLALSKRVAKGGPFERPLFGTGSFK